MPTCECIPVQKCNSPQGWKVHYTDSLIKDILSTTCFEFISDRLVANPKIRAFYSRVHQPSLAGHPRAHLLQTGSPDIPINPQHFTKLRTVVFHPCRRHDIKTTAAVFCLSSSRSTARSTLYSRQTGVPSCQRQHVERPSVPHHICSHSWSSDSVSRLSSSLVPTQTS